LRAASELYHLAGAREKVEGARQAAPSLLRKLREGFCSSNSQRHPVFYSRCGYSPMAR
jgi:hypothetical protein